MRSCALLILLMMMLIHLCFDPVLEHDLQQQLCLLVYESVIYCRFALRYAAGPFTVGA